MLCRYDVGVLKSADIFSIHGFPVGLIQCESNFLGIYHEPLENDLFEHANRNRTTTIGSGGWANIIEKYMRAKAYCAQPFEIPQRGRRKVPIAIEGEWIGDTRPNLPPSARRQVDLRCQTATTADLPPHSLDAVLTDPPYFSNVQYAELMDFCFVWLRRLVRATESTFTARSTRDPDELTGNDTLNRGLDHFTDGLSAVFCRMAPALKPGAPLAFTYHNNDLDAYVPVAVAILDAGFACTASLPCPGEMTASVHINGTASSVINTVFVCRSGATAQCSVESVTPQEFLDIVRRDIAAIETSGIETTAGDVRVHRVWAVGPIGCRNVAPRLECETARTGSAGPSEKLAANIPDRRGRPRRGDSPAQSGSTAAAGNPTAVEASKARK